MRMLLLAVLTIFSVSVSAETDWDVNDVLLKLKSANAKQFIATLTPPDDIEMKTYGSLLDKIETATPQWLEVAKLLKPYADAAVAESLQITLAQAIKNNPAGVLKILTPSEVKWSCSAPLIEPTEKEYNAFLNTTLAAVTTINSKELASKKALCIKELNSSKGLFK